MAKNNPVNIPLTDLHTHILPGIDDGARDLDHSLNLLQAEKASGVERVALTPHFYPLRDDLDEFLENRRKAYAQLRAAWDVETMPQLRLGAEVHYSPCLAELPLRTLVLAQSNYLLLELSDTVVPAHIESVIELMKDQGITPILAHVERCVYFREYPERLFKLVEQGAMAQIGAHSLLGGEKKKFAEICLRKGVAQILASDLHNLGRSKACLGDATAELDGEMVTTAEAFARAVWDNEAPPTFTPAPIKRKLFGYA